MRRRIGLPLLLIVAALVFVPGLAGAGKPVKGSQAATSSITLNQSDPHLGGNVTFTSVFPNSLKDPSIAVWCYQNGQLGYMATNRYDQSFLLGGMASNWQRSGGAAQCKAELYYYSYQGGQQEYHNLAWTSFDAAG